MAPYTITINSFRTILNLDDLIDHLIAKKIIHPALYKNVWSKDPEDRLNYVVDFITKADFQIEQYVLKYLHGKHPNIEEIERDKHYYHEALVRGGFPKLAKNTVKRTSEAETLTNKLKNLMPRDKLVVHGMMGCGKSFLVNQILNDVGIVKNYFDYKIFWINLGEHQKKLDNVISTMWRLYSCVAGKEASLTHCPEDLETLKFHVKQIFLMFEMQKSLLILDDAGNDQLIKHFDFGCKTVITTKNKGIVPSNEGTFVEVKAAFTASETLEMFSCLGDTEEIREHARDIYDICKGHPLVVGAISSFLNESKEDVGNPKIWQHIKENLSSGHYQFDETLQNAIKICVDNLKDDLKPYFYDLSIFPEDVNIPPEVLEILWQKKMIEVRKIMNQLANRSLVISFYHNNHKTYVYGVHDVFLNYLKAVTKDRKRDMHKKLIDAYNRITNNNYLKLPNDNYTLQYIGFHLKEAHEMEKFKIFLNLHFIEAKIRAAGHDDVLRDMENYGIYINHGNKDDKKLNDYRHFIKRFGPDIFYNNKTDIIQFALQEKTDSHVYSDALAIATSNPSYPYFKLKNPRDLKRSSYKLKAEQDITSACFLNANEIFIGTINGDIEKYSHERKIYTLKGHTNKIISLKLNDTKTQLLSISEDHTVRLWKLRLNTRKSWDLSAHGSKADPKEKQKDWQSIIINEPLYDFKEFKLNDNEDYCVAAAFSPNTLNEIAIGTNKGVIIIWNTDTMQQICSTQQRRGYAVNNLLFVKKDIDPHVVCVINMSIFKYVYKNAKLEYVYQLHNQVVPSAVFVCTPDKSPEIVALVGSKIVVWNFLGMPKNRTYDLNEDCDGAILTNDSRYLIISTMGNSLCIWDNRQLTNIDVLYYSGLTKSLDTFYDGENSAHVLLISSDRKTLQQCEIKLQEEIRINSKFPEFSCWWNKTRPLTAVRGKTNQIEIYQNYQMIAQTPIMHDNITYTKFCDTDHVVYGLESGQVRLFQLKNKNDRLLTAVEGRISYIELFSCAQNKKSYLIVSKNDLDSTCTIWPHNSVQVFFSLPKLFFKKNDNMFVIEGNGNISSWNLTENATYVLHKSVEILDVITATICSSQKHLALTFLKEGDYFLQIYEVFEDYISIIKTINIDDIPNFSCYSFDGTLLAIGMKSGNIQVWNTVNKYQDTKLKLHETPVEYLLFSPGLVPILVSLGDQIAWWNLKKFKTGRSFRKQPSIEDEDLVFRSTMNPHYWSSKRLFKHDQYLIACVKSHEQYAKLISASPDFTSFLTVDGTGKIYIMEVV